MRQSGIFEPDWAFEDTKEILTFKCDHGIVWFCLTKGYLLDIHTKYLSVYTIQTVLDASYKVPLNLSHSGQSWSLLSRLVRLLRWARAWPLHECTASVRTTLTTCATDRYVHRGGPLPCPGRCEVKLEAKEG